MQTDKYSIRKSTFSFPAKKSPQTQWCLSNNRQALYRGFYNVRLKLLTSPEGNLPTSTPTQNSFMRIKGTIPAI